eukprot:scaffold669679_cov59-Prasinocladus_malaysianus.AAC.2
MKVAYLRNGVKSLETELEASKSSEDSQSFIQTIEAFHEKAESCLEVWLPKASAYRRLATC